MTRSAEDTTPTTEEIQAQLERILASKGFVNSDQRTNLLTYLVTQTIDGKKPTEADVCADVFPHQPLPPENRIVSVVATDVRKRLQDYYEARPDDPVNIEVPRVERRTAYQAKFSCRRSRPAIERYNLGLQCLSEGSLKSSQLAAWLLDEAVRLDPTYGLAYAALADAQLQCVLRYALQSAEREGPVMDNETGEVLTFERSITATRMTCAQEAAEAAVRLAPGLWRPHIVLATAHASRFEWAKAYSQFQRANALAPNEATIDPLYAAFLAAKGEVGDALEIIEQRIKRWPSDQLGYALERLLRHVALPPPPSFSSRGLFAEDTGKPDRENDMRLHWLTRVVQNLDYLKLHPKIGIVNRSFRTEQAKMEFLLFGLECFGVASFKEPQLFWSTKVEGSVQEYLDQTLEWDYPVPTDLPRAVAYLALGIIMWHGGIPEKWCVTKDRPLWNPLSVPVGDDPRRNAYSELFGNAVACVEAACNDRHPVMAWLHLLPIFDLLRGRPDFDSLIERLNLRELHATPTNGKER